MPSGEYIRKPRRVERLHCTCCEKAFVRTFLKYMPKLYGAIEFRRAVFIDESGRQINGRECSDCKYGKRETAAA